MARVEHLAEGVTLYLGNCLEIMPALGQVDHTFADPPYEDHMHAAKKAGQRAIRTDGHAEPQPLDFSSIEHMREPAARQIVEATAGWALIFCTPEGIAPWRDVIERVGARYKRACFWHKPDAAPQFNGQGPAFAVEAFVTAWCGPGFSKWNGGGRRNMFDHPTNGRDRHGVHPTEKPVSLFCELVDLFSQHGETILDPFMGSGTTGVAAVKRGRRFIGIEQDKAYFEIACKRISGALDAPDMFIPKVAPLKQEAFL